MISDTDEIGLAQVSGGRKSAAMSSPSRWRRRRAVVTDPTGQFGEVMRERAGGPELHSAAPRTGLTDLLEDTDVHIHRQKVPSKDGPRGITGDRPEPGLHQPPVRGSGLDWEITAGTGCPLRYPKRCWRLIG
jgi:hypothetical protein